MKIPFTTEQFFAVMEKYNLTLFPAQIVILLLGIMSVLLVFTRVPSRHKWAGVFLGLLWIWMGIAYHLAFFTSINKAAYVFGTLFILQGILFQTATFSKAGLPFEFQKNDRGLTGVFLIFFGLVIYPLLSYLIAGTAKTTIILGLPCPSTIFTFGFLLLASGRIPRYLLIIPLIWALIGTSAAVKFGVYPDYMLIFSAGASLFLILRSKGKTAGPDPLKEAANS
jgi:hypothetical protein